MKLTETLAIIISRDMWLWLSENPEICECYDKYDECEDLCNMCKRHYPLYNEFYLGEMLNSECPCCEYYIEMKKIEITKRCNGCPLGNCKTGSYWWEWSDGINRQENAYKIYKQLDDKLNSIED